MIRSFHVRLIVADFDRCFRFYRDVLGLRVTWGEEIDGSASGYASFEIPDGSLSINDQRVFAPVVGFETREPGETAKDRAALIFEVESVDQETERLRARWTSCLRLSRRPIPAGASVRHTSATPTAT